MTDHRSLVLAAVPAVLAALACGGGAAPEVVAPLPAPSPTPTPTAAGGCPEGVITAESWPGEWPMPIVQVKSEASLEGRTDPCDAEATVDCAVPAGVYHPWSFPANAVYKTVRALQKWEATRDTTVEGTSYSKGTVVVVEQYQGEGYCSVRIDGGEPTQELCPGVMDDDGFRELPGVEMEDRQVFSVTCGGDRVWIDAADAMEHPNVVSGEFLDWGSVGVAGSGGWTP